MLKMRLLACLTAALLTSCATSGLGTDTGCLWTSTIYISKADVLTDGTARQLLGHNRAREANCAQ